MTEITSEALRGLQGSPSDLEIGGCHRRELRRYGKDTVEFTIGTGSSNGG